MFLSCSLKGQFRPIAEEEVTRLQEFAWSEGFTDKLEMWDLPYWRRRQKQHLFKYFFISIFSCVRKFSIVMKCNLFLAACVVNFVRIFVPKHHSSVATCFEVSSRSLVTRFDYYLDLYGSLIASKRASG